MNKPLSDSHDVDVKPVALLFYLVVTLLQITD